MVTVELICKNKNEKESITMTQRVMGYTQARVRRVEGIRLGEVSKKENTGRLEVMEIIALSNQYGARVHTAQCC